MKNKAVFLDRDGVINKERGTYTFLPEDFEIIDGVPESIALLKKNGFKIIVITNQSGISQGLYSKEMMVSCHNKMMAECQQLIDDIYYAKWHPNVSESLFRKPDSLMIERAIALHEVDLTKSWLIGDKERDILSGRKVDLKTILIGDRRQDTNADLIAVDLREAVNQIISCH